MGILDRFRLDGKVAVVTGASSGLGVAIAIALAEAGADVAIGARRVERLQSIGAEIESVGRSAMTGALDVTLPEDCQRFVDEVVETFGHVDVLVNNAGAGAAALAVSEPPEHFRAIVDVNLMGAYWMAQACGRVMGSGSSIINVGSVLGFTTMQLPQAAYCASKAALAGLTRDLAQQWTGRRGIRVNLLAPGFFPTEMTAHYKAGYIEKMTEMRIPAGRVGELEECASAVVFLASEASSYVTGTVLAVDGGLLIT